MMQRKVSKDFWNAELLVFSWRNYFPLCWYNCCHVAGLAFYPRPPFFFFFFPSLNLLLHELQFHVFTFKWRKHRPIVQFTFLGHYRSSLCLSQGTNWVQYLWFFPSGLVWPAAVSQPLEKQAIVLFRAGAKQSK